jgi:hypothetical protein
MAAASRSPRTVLISEVGCGWHLVVDPTGARAHFGCRGDEEAAAAAAAAATRKDAALDAGEVSLAARSSRFLPGLNVRVTSELGWIIADVQ